MRGCLSGWLAMSSRFVLLVCVGVVHFDGVVAAADPIRVLIVDGQNNHGVWPKTTQMMKAWLEQSGRFSVDVATAAPKGTDPNFRPEFGRYGAVVSNFGHGAAPWPEETRESFERYVRGGGGFVVVHAADNSFP